MAFDVALEDGELALEFPYHPRHVEAIKRLRARRFDPETKRWCVPRQHAPELHSALRAAEAPEAWLSAIAPHVREVIAETAARQARVRAAYEAALPTLEADHPGLFAHQREGVAFLLRPREGRGALLADEMGLGKTRQAIVAAEALAAARPVLVVCPASLKLNWAREIRLALGPEAEIGIAERGRCPLARWTIVNYDVLRRHHARLMAEPWGALILDEAHYLKNLRAQRTRLVIGGEQRLRRDGTVAAARVRGLVEGADAVYALTGTPITNRPLDLFPLLKAIGHPLGDDLLAYAVRYCAAFQNAHGWDMRGASHLEELHAGLEPVLLRRRRDEVLSLPPKLRTYMPVEVDLVAYRRVWLDHLAKRARRKRRMPRAMLLAEITKLRQAAAIAKIPAAIALCEGFLEAGEKALVYTNFQAVVDALMARFGDAAVRVVGADDARARQAAQTAFQDDPSVKLFVANLQAAGVGLSLTAASQVLFVDYALVPAAHLQAEDRPCRIGQHHAVTVTYLSAVDTIDEDVEPLLAQKLGVATAAIDGHDPTVWGSYLDDMLAVVERRAAEG